MREVVRGRLLYRLAGPADEADLRTLLRAHPLPGWVRLRGRWLLLGLLTCPTSRPCVSHEP